MRRSPGYPRDGAVLLRLVALVVVMMRTGGHLSRLEGGVLVLINLGWWVPDYARTAPQGHGGRRSQRVHCVIGANGCCGFAARYRNRFPGE